jgi:hypothetical protein
MEFVKYTQDSGVEVTEYTREDGLTLRGQSFKGDLERWYIYRLYPPSFYKDSEWVPLQAGMDLSVLRYQTLEEAMRVFLSLPKV